MSPEINGVRAGWADVEIRFNGVPQLGVTRVDFVQVDHTGKVSGGVSLLLREADLFLRSGFTLTKIEIHHKLEHDEHLEVIENVETCGVSMYLTNDDRGASVKTIRFTGVLK